MKRILKKIIKPIRKYMKEAKKFVDEYRREWIIGMSVMALAIAIGVGLSLQAKPIDEVGELPEVVEETVVDSCNNRNLIDGVCRTDDSVEGLPVVVMIDNNVGARPPVGLTEAKLVYEAIAEGTITRLTTVFSADQDLAMIGPIRSARPYFVDWAEEFHGIYAHVGGSPAGLEQLYSSDLYDFNQFAYGPYFWRHKSRYAPHNVMTSMENIRSAIEKKEWTDSTAFEPWLFKDEAPTSEGLSENNIVVDFGSYNHTVEWEYQTDSNSYLRYQAGKEHRDNQGVAVQAKNVAVMYTKSIPIDDYGRRSTLTVGEGRAIVFLDGAALPGTWKRDSQESRTRFYTEAGDEIAFNSGTTWIEVVPNHYPDISY